MSARPRLVGLRLLALDVGSRRIGVAVSDHAGLMAHPLTTLDAHGPARDCAAVLAFYAAEDATGVVLGLPAHANGTESESAARVRKLEQRLAQAGVPTDFQDEWGTTVEAQEALAHRSRAQKRKSGRAVVDQAAAVAILRAYLEERSNWKG